MKPTRREALAAVVGVGVTSYRGNVRVTPAGPLDAIELELLRLCDRLEEQGNRETVSWDNAHALAHALLSLERRGYMERKYDGPDGKGGTIALMRLTPKGHLAIEVRS